MFCFLSCLSMWLIILCEQLMMWFIFWCEMWIWVLFGWVIVFGFWYRFSRVCEMWLVMFMNVMWLICCEVCSRWLVSWVLIVNRIFGYFLCSWFFISWNSCLQLILVILYGVCVCIIDLCCVCLMNRFILLMNWLWLMQVRINLCFCLFLVQIVSEFLIM